MLPWALPHQDWPSPLCWPGMVRAHQGGSGLWDTVGRVFSARARLRFPPGVAGRGCPGQPRCCQVTVRQCGTQVPPVNVVVCRDPTGSERGDCIDIALLKFTSRIHDFQFGKSDGHWPGSSLECSSLTWESLLLHVAVHLLQRGNAGCSPCK